MGADTRPEKSIIMKIYSLNKPSLNQKFLIYILLLPIILIWLANFISYYLWIDASLKIGHIAFYDGINDPNSIGWSKDYFKIGELALMLGLISIIPSSIITAYFYFSKKNEVSIRIKLISLLGVLLFFIIVFGGYLAWWAD